MRIAKRTGVAVATVAGLAVLAAGLLAQAQPPAALGFTTAQADTGKTAYTALCSGCHGANLEGGGPAVSLNSDAFRAKWSGRPALDLMTAIRSMPPGTEPRAPEANAALLAFLLRESRLATVGAATPAADAQLAAVRIGGGTAQAAAGGGGRGGRGAPPTVPTLTFHGSPKLDKIGTDPAIFVDRLDRPVEEPVGCSGGFGDLFPSH